MFYIKKNVKYLPSTLFFLLIFIVSCSYNDSNIIKEIKIGLHNNNELKIEIAATTIKNAKVFATYWPDSTGPAEKMTTAITNEGLSHVMVLTNILPQTNYSYQLTTIRNGVKTLSKIYSFKSNKLPEWLQDQFKYNSSNPGLLPAAFTQGFMLMNKRETPGIAYIIDYTGRIRWYHTVDGTGFKVIQFTKDSTVIGILGKNDEPTSYGSEILEVNLLGDTMLYLKKGQGDLKYAIHHEILKRNSDTIVTLFVDKRIMDLRSIGGLEKDTVNGDGILILNKQGKKIWQWSVFDVMDPLKDPQLLKTKKDWMHANSLNYDKDSNYIISFYNNGQIWKLNAATGKIMWKYGKEGNIKMPADYSFSQAHAVHINPSGSLMFFDNGVEKKQSEVFAVKLDETTMTASPDIHIKLPVELYNERMGSAYMIGDSLVLCCCSKKHFTVLTDKAGAILWKLQTAIPPYRVQFLQPGLLKPFINPISDRK